MADMTTQRYDTHMIVGAEGVPIIEKPHDPYTYEYYNEVRWLGWAASGNFEAFTVPRLLAADPLTGIVQMEFIAGEAADESTRGDVLTAVQELHTSQSSPIAMTRRGTLEKTEFPAYLVSTVDARVAQMDENGIDLPGSLANGVRQSVGSLNCAGGFSPNHKDLRYRHAIIRTDSKPVGLIDWEFGNVAHPAQDLAKFSYDRRDQATRHGHELELADIVEDTVRKYVEAGGHPSYRDEELLAAVWALYPLAPIERSRSLLDRKPQRYRKEVQRDIGLVEEWRDVVDWRTRNFAVAGAGIGRSL